MNKHNQDRVDRLRKIGEDLRASEKEVLDLALEAEKVLFHNTDDTCEACGCRNRWTSENITFANVKWIVCECGHEQEITQ